MVMNLAIILARGGSKRLPNKNILPLNGFPMIYWTINAVLNSGCFDRVVVSTDSAEIADVAISYGVDVPFLRDSKADDISASSDASIYALRQSETFWDEKYANVTQLMANCPLRTESDIQQSLNHYHASAASSQISCFKFGWMNPWWSVELDSNLSPKWNFPEASKRRSQDLPDLYCPSGAIWTSSRQSLLRNNSFYSEDVSFFPIHWTSAVDIDDIDDFLMAQAVFKLRELN